MKRILCTGAGGSATTNFIRSLRMAPEPFYIVGVDVSKYYLELSKADVNYIVPKCTEDGYIDALNKIIEKENIEFVHPQPDPEVLVISKNRDELKARTFLPFSNPPHYNDIEIGQSKSFTAQELKVNRVPCPKYATIDVKEQLETEMKLMGGDKFWLRANKGAGSLAALPITEAKQGIMWIDYWATRGIGWGEFVLNEYLPGREFAFQSLWKDGEMVTSFARQRIEYLFQNRMPSGQSSTPTIAKSVHNEVVNNTAYQAIRSISKFPHGVYCVDLKERADGVACVTEINVGRFFTTCLFGSVAGCNMPYYYIKAGYLEKIPQLPKFNAIPADLFWIRQIDCGETMVKEGGWKSLLLA